MREGRERERDEVVVMDTIVSAIHTSHNVSMPAFGLTHTLIFYLKAENRNCRVTKIPLYKAFFMHNAGYLT